MKEKKNRIKKDLFNGVICKEGNRQTAGITLIALVITIVVLIILAGVLINISLGNNGLFNKAKTAKEMYTNAQEHEETEIAKMTNNIDGIVTTTRDVTYCTTPATTVSTASITNPCVVIENYKNGTEWYRVWSDGWIEQGGYKASNGTITFLKKFSDTNYTVTGGLVPGDATQTYEHLNLTSFTATGFRYYTYDGYKLKWYACGY